MPLTRRSVIQGAVGSLALVGGLPVWARGEQQPDEPAPTDYLRLSAALVGADPARLEPETRDGEIALADTFHALSVEAAPDATAAMLAAWREAAPRGDEAGGDQTAPRGDEAAGDEAAGRLLAGGGRARADGVGALARLTMLMWLYGVWYGATETARMPDSAAVIGPDHRTDLVVSVRAYRNGWIWRLAQARPMGVAGEPGSWAEAPPGLDDFLDGA